MKIRCLIIIGLIQLTIGEKLDSDIVKNYSEFFNFGNKKLASKIDKAKYENSIFKSKVDILGAVFKKNVDDLKSKGILDLVFLIDASSSVGEYNFKSELKFVKKLLSDVTVDYNHTRVAVVTFSSQNNVVINIDEITNPKATNNKCLLLNKEINEIKYTGGGTYTLGAFKIAKEIFTQSRDEAQKVLFLITDGFSNGGNPVPISSELKSSQVTIFTIGILNGNYKELYELSSEPGELHSYLLDSFEEFESLARRALHVDLQSGEYIPLGFSKPCDGLCEGGDCCDRHALCTCGTSTGHYSCLCEPGYYGSGLKNSCSPCPSGSYSSGPNLCLPCPDIHHYTRPPATGIESCTCKTGYKATETYGCEVIKCPKLEAPENGYFVKRKDCTNVLNSACGVRCNVGYTLIGSSIRLCQTNATWSGLNPSCQVKTCTKLHIPAHGSMSCKHADLGEDFTLEAHLPVDTVCTFTCERGRTLIGSSQRTCLPLAQWDGLRTACKQIKCNKVSKINFGTVEPKSCTIGKQPFGKMCNFTCDEGFELDGPEQKVCTGEHGTWDTQDEVSCRDVQKPNLTCPEDVKGETLKGKAYGIVDWIKPVVTDNSRLNVTIWTKPSIKSVAKFKIGKTQVTYFAQDSFNNRAKCTFTVEIEDKEPPTIETCVDPLPFLITSDSPADITWDEPNIFDNSQKVQVIKSRDFGVFPSGTSQVTYTAMDDSNNTNTCVLNITVQESKCEALPDPIFGHSKCQPFSDSIHCVVTCEEGYALPLSEESTSVEDNATKFICDHSQPFWYNQKGGAFPECTVSEIPVEVNQTGVVEAEGKELCTNQSRLKEFENEIKAMLENNIQPNCEGAECNLQTETQCVDKIEEDEEEVSNIIKRDVAKAGTKKKKRRKKVNIKFHFRTKNKAKMNNLDAFEKKLRNVTDVKGVQLKFHLEKAKLSCPVGSYGRKYKCVRCPHGTFHNSTLNACQSCPIGAYNNKMGQSSCVACPNYFSTRKLHAKSLQDCIEQCPPGTFAHKKQIKRPKNHPNSVLERVTLKPYCSSCPLGQFQANYGKTTCQNCPYNFTTFNRGAKNANECMQSQICSSQNPCLNGICVVENEFIYSCSCDDYFIGQNCETPVNPCTSNPCQNNATCTFASHTYTCECSEGYAGKNCAEIVEKCDLDCNTGKCLIAEEDEKVCVCPKGFGGEFCQTKFSYCRDNLCENEGTCEEDNDGFQCICRLGFMGRRCSYLPCDYHPCGSNTVCINLENSTQHICECLPGFKGPNCLERIDFCKGVACNNRGNCVAFQESYKCNCAKGFEGHDCENVLRTDYVLNFPRSSVTDYVALDGPQENITEISICLWVNTADNFNYGTIISYANNDFDNAFTITDYTGLVLYINNNYVVTDVLLNDGIWHHFCAIWKSFKGQYEIYLDGKLAFSRLGLSPNSSIKGGGKLVIGQEQDVLGGRFSQSESFLGKMAHLDIYAKALNLQEIDTIMNSCDLNHFGDVVAWPEFAKFTKGDIKIEDTTFCKSCPIHEPLYNGNIKIINTTTFYECNSGFNLTSYHSGRRCLKASRWEGSTKPFCKAVNCGHPGYIRNGYFIGRSYLYLDEITYKCNYGYNLTGANFRTCSSLGVWEPDEPKCLGIQCEKFNITEHMVISVLYEEDASNEDNNAFEIGSQVEISCTSDAKLEGEKLLTCTHDGTWDYDPPICKSEKPIWKLPCSLDHIPEAPINGFMLNESFVKVLQGLTDVVEYKCRRGFRLIGDNSSTCIIDGYWSEMKISCVPRSCGEPPKYPNMVLKSAEENNFHPIGSMVSYQCVPGYKAFKLPKIQCVNPGNWSKMQVFCTKISCGKPSVSAGTRILGRSYLFNDEIKLICEGKEQDIKCGSDGNWISKQQNVC